VTIEASRFDPVAILDTLDRHRVSFVVVGSFARVIHGADEVPDSIDIVPSLRPDAAARLVDAMQSLGADATNILRLADREAPVEIPTPAGLVKLVAKPAGTRGYDDLRRGATREPLGSGVRAPVAGVGDLIRMLASLDRTEDRSRLDQLRQLADLERSRDRGLSR
jgi:hypothetical protein